MQSKRIAMLFPYAPAYREPIYKLMDQELQIDWYFAGNAKRNLKLFDYSCLKHCNLELNEQVFGPIRRLKGIDKSGLDRYDVIIFAGVIRSLSEWWLMLRYGKRKSGPRLFLWTHGWYGRENVIEKLIKKFFFSWADGIFLYGNYAKDLMIKEGFDPKKLFVIHNSLDYHRQLSLRQSIQPTSVYKEHFGNDFPTIVFIGRLTFEKKLDMLINVVANLRQQNENYNIAFIGDGEARQELEVSVQECNLSERIWFYGACYDEKTNAELIYNADICVSPGNIGLTAIHVLMFGCPAITHNTFAYQGPEFEAIRAGETGAFFEKDQIDSLASTISNWFESKSDKREEVRRACYKEIDESWNPEYQLKVLKSTLG